jgi:hypothetical protein
VISNDDILFVRNLLRAIDDFDSEYSTGYSAIHFKCDSRLDELLIGPNGWFCYSTGGIDLMYGFCANKLAVREGSTDDSFMICFLDETENGVTPRFLIAKFDGILAIRALGHRQEKEFNFPLQV